MRAREVSSTFGELIKFIGYFQPTNFLGRRGRAEKGTTDEQNQLQESRTCSRCRCLITGASLPFQKQNQTNTAAKSRQTKTKSKQLVVISKGIQDFLFTKSSASSNTRGNGVFSSTKAALSVHSDGVLLYSEHEN